MLQVPQLDFTDLNYIKALDDVSRDTNLTNNLAEWQWTGPSQPLEHIALAVMGLGQILPIRPPPPNATWALDFWNPALRYNDVEASKRDSIRKNIWNSYSGSHAGSYAALSWVPWSPSDVRIYGINLTGSDIDRDLPFIFNTSRNSSSIGPPPASLSTDGPASLFIAIMPETQNFQQCFLK